MLVRLPTAFATLGSSVPFNVALMTRSNAPATERTSDKERSGPFGSNTGRRVARPPFFRPSVAASLWKTHRGGSLPGSGRARQTPPSFVVAVHFAVMTRLLPRPR